MITPKALNTRPVRSESAPSPLLVRFGLDGEWQVAEHWVQVFNANLDIDWFNLAGDTRAVAVKANPNRRVWRVQLGDHLFYAKVFRQGDWVNRLRRLFRRPGALVEWRAGQYAESTGVPCVRFVACGVRKRGLGKTESVLITEADRGATTLPVVWRRLQQTDHPAERRQAALRLAGAVARLPARAHQARFLHRDGHPGNILVRGADTRSPSAVYVDLYGASVGAATTGHKAAANIAQLDQWFQRHAGRTTRLRFLKDYLTERFGEGGASRPALQRWAAMIAGARRRNAAVLYAQRDRRVRRRGSYFAMVLLGGGWRATVALRFRNRDEFPAPTHPDRTEASWHDLLTRHVQQPNALQMLADDSTIERWQARSPGQRLAWRLSWSPARRAFAIGHGLRHRDVPCVWPLAMLERRTAFGVSECRLLTERRPDCRPLTDLLASRGRQAGRRQAAEQGQAALESAGRLLADGTLRGLRWPALRPAALWVECPPGAGSRPRALLGRFEGIILHRQQDSQAAAAAVLALVEELADYPGVEAADISILLRAFRRRMGRAFHKPTDWPNI